ncbi:MAG: ATP-dependent sacrificial sulfur transferase LarE [Promethearchaeota archaeon]
MTHLAKFDKVRESLRGKKVLVAFSGGVDSSVMALLAREVAEEVVLLTVNTATFTGPELNHAKRVADELGLKQILVSYDWVADKELAANTRERCYVCKKKLAQLWLSEAEKRGFQVVVEGTTASDLEDFRPGKRALRELKISSPLLEEGITKEEVRVFAAEKHLSVAERPSMACLATRFPYDMEITNDMLDMVLRTEIYVREKFGVETVRARYHDELVRIEVGYDEREKLFNTDKLDDLQEFAKDVGFSYVTLDVKGYRMGAMDET